MIHAPARSPTAAASCIVLLVLFTAIAWLSARTKSPAFDEPYHAISAWVQWNYFDYRLDNEDPPLWQYWASLLNSKSAIQADFAGDIWKTMPDSLAHQWYWGVQTLYRTPGNDPDKLIAHCRAMMLIVAVGLGVLICVWSWQLGGPIAAVSATFLFCLDPNFLAHSPLMKNDVAFAMSMVALVFAVWKAGEKLTAGRLGWVALLCVVTLTVKFSGLLAVCMVPLLLGIRALLPMQWNVLGKSIGNRRGRLAVAAAVTLLAMLVSIAGIWAVYGFRYRPTPQPGVAININPIADRIRLNAMIARYHGSPPPGAGPDIRLPMPARAAMFANEHHLLPQGFLAGFLFTYANGLVRFAYAEGQISPVGWWWYFPFAILVKTPIATLLAIGWAVVYAIRRKRPRDKQFQASRGVQPWALICLLTPAILFLLAAMAQNLNIGLRHVLAIYPFLFIAIGVIIARLWTTRGRKTRSAICLLATVLTLETVCAFPNFIAFFNPVATTVSSKLEMLGDSNLDWGQDLPLLAQWQRAHPDRKLYLCYFGYADPRHYGVHYIPMPGGYRYDSKPHLPEPNPLEPAVIAISASNLQGFPLEDEKLADLIPYYRQWASRKPIAVLGDTIYLFEN